jgi:Protein of unknown function (DUF2845)
MLTSWSEVMAMKNIKTLKCRLCAILIVLVALFTESALAFKCGRFIVDEGDYKDDVYDKCGEPDSVQSHYEKRGNIAHGAVGIGNNPGYRYGPSTSFNAGQAYYQEVDILVEEWLYDFGSSRMRQLLRFENGRLKEIENLGRRRRR